MLTATCTSVYILFLMDYHIGTKAVNMITRIIWIGAISASFMDRGQRWLSALDVLQAGDRSVFSIWNVLGLIRAKTVAISPGT